MIGDKYELQIDIKYAKVANKEQIFNCIFDTENNKNILVDSEGLYFCDEDSIMSKVNCKKIIQ